MGCGLAPQLAQNQFSELIKRGLAPMTWYTQHRQEWIAETLRVFGYINREHIERKFGVSTPQASLDLREFQRNHPQCVTYNKTAKRYEQAK